MSSSFTVIRHRKGEAGGACAPPAGRVRSLAVALAVAFCCSVLSSGAEASDPYVDSVRSFEPGASAGFGLDGFPLNLFGPPEGAGELAGSVDVVSLGEGGVITVVFRDNVVVDGPGDDLVIFENPFYAGAVGGLLFTEYALVQVSGDGKRFFEFPFDTETAQGLAGQVPVVANSANAIDPLSEQAGGDRFDLADVGLAFARYVRLIDAEGIIDDLGDLIIPGTKGGFDLDAAAALNSVAPGVVAVSVTVGGAARGGVKVKLIPEGEGKKTRRRTRADGTCRFRRVIPSGEYRVRARVAGRGIAEETIALEGEAPMSAVDLAFD